MAPTETEAWDRAHEILGVLGGSAAANPHQFGRGITTPQNVGSQRLLEIASRGEIFDRTLWTPTVTATRSWAAAAALVGSPETIAASILDYIETGAELISIRGYDRLDDLRQVGRSLLPLVREELAHRAATGRRGPLQDEHLGALREDHRERRSPTGGMD